MNAIEVDIGCETWAYEVIDSYTNIIDPDGNHALQLRWPATENEVKAAAWGFGAGLKMGQKVGEAAKLAEIQRVLCITPNVDSHNEISTI